MASLTLRIHCEGEAQTFTQPILGYVHNRVEHFSYFPEVREGSVPVAYIETEEIDPDFNLQIANRSYQLPGNSLSYAMDKKSFDKITGVSYTSLYKDLLITNQTYVDPEGQVQPLFWKHILPEGTTEVTLTRVTQGNNSQLDYGYKVVLSENALYTNYLNEYDEDTQSYTLYYVSWSTPDSKGQELLSPQVVVKEATWEDVDPETGTYKSGVRAYTRETTSSGTVFYFSSGDTYYVKQYVNSLIQPISPAGRVPRDPWYLQVSVGDIRAFVNDKARRYWIPEFDLQYFYPYKPYVFSTYDTLLRVNDVVISTTKQRVIFDPDAGLHINIFIYSYEDVLLRAITSDQSKANTKYSDTNVVWETDQIISVDETGGFISLGFKVHPSYKLSGQYFYEAKDYEIKDIDLNPLSNKKMLNHMVVFYVVPDVEASDKAIHYLLVDESGYVVYCSQGLGLGHPNLKLRNEDGTYNSNSPVGIKYISQSSGNPSFVKDFTAGYENEYGYVVLAEVSYRETSAISDQVVFPLKNKTPAFKDSKKISSYRKNPLSAYSPYGYGSESHNALRIPKEGVVIVRVPINITEDYGGVFKESEVKAELAKCFDASVYPVIEWTYPKSKLSCDPTVSEELTLSWRWEGPDRDYKLYRRPNNGTSWTLIDTQSDPPEALLTYTDSGLTADEVWEYAVRITLNGIEYPISNIVSAKVKP